MSDMMDVCGVMHGEGTFNWNFSSPEYNQMAAYARESETRFKALTTGQGVVLDGTTGGAALRVQYLHETLENVSAKQDDCKLMKLVPKRSVPNTTIEYDIQGDYGNGGDGFVDETGTDGAFNVDTADDNYQRQTEYMSYMAAGREVGLVTTLVNNIVDPLATTKEAATREILIKANRAGYFGNRGLGGSQFNGIIAQLEAWALANPMDEDIFVDCAGQPLDRNVFEDSLGLSQTKFAAIDVLLMSSFGHSDTNKLLFPEQRGTDGNSNSRYGVNMKTFAGPAGDVRLEIDPLLRIGEPLRPSGPGSDGKPRLTATVNGMFAPDAFALGFASNPFVAASGANGCQAVAPGNASFLARRSKNTDAGTFSATPSIPSGSNHSNNLPAATYYYGVAPVYRGREGALYIFGAGVQANPVISGTPTGTAVTQGQVLQLDFDCTTPSITGLGPTYGRANIQWRVYRALVVGGGAPTRVDQFKYLDTCGTPISGNARLVDNGMKVPGTDNAFGLTMQKDGRKGVEMLQLLPLMRRMGLPNKAMSEPVVLLWFATIMLWRRRQHMHFYNIGRAV